MPGVMLNCLSHMQLGSEQICLQCLQIHTLCIGSLISFLVMLVVSEVSGYRILCQTKGLAVEIWNSIPDRTVYLTIRFDIYLLVKKILFLIIYE